MTITQAANKRRLLLRLSTYPVHHVDDRGQACENGHCQRLNAGRRAATGASLKEHSSHKATKALSLFMPTSSPAPASSSSSSASASASPTTSPSPRLDNDVVAEHEQRYEEADQQEFEERRHVQPANFLRAMNVDFFPGDRPTDKQARKQQSNKPSYRLAEQGLSFH